MMTQNNDRVMNKAVLILKEMSADEKIQELARIRERALHDEASYLQDARAEGRAEGFSMGEMKGRAEGRAMGKAEGINAVLEAMRAAGMDTSQVEALSIS